jgi:mono/diheme cytochrome c family protein
MRYFLLIFALTVAAVVGIAGCRGTKFRRPPLYIFPDMERQPKLRPQTADGFFANGLSSRLPVAGTLPRSEPVRVGGQPVYSWQDAPVNTGRVTGATNYVETNPLPVTAEFLDRGQEVFNINCAPCHSRLGDGNGVPKRINAMAVVADLHDKRIVELTDGELFNTISNGKNLMPGYAANLGIQDRWAAIAYLRALQLSRLASLDDVPAAERGNLPPH